MEKFAKQYPHLDFPEGVDPQAEELLLQLLHPASSCRIGATVDSAKRVTTALFFRSQDWERLSKQEVEAPAVL